VEAAIPKEEGAKEQGNVQNRDPRTGIPGRDGPGDARERHDSSLCADAGAPSSRLGVDAVLARLVRRRVFNALTFDARRTLVSPRT
jgi:hypothetical protein